MLDKELRKLMVGATIKGTATVELCYRPERWDGRP